MKKPIKSIRTNTLLHDKDTNVVYLSPWLRICFPCFYQRLLVKLEIANIKVRELKNTNDYWARDYMPIQLGENEFLKYKYNPDYLNQKEEDRKYITNCTNVLRGMGIKCRSIKLIIDGGNMVPCGQYIVMTDKVFTENEREKGDADFHALLELELGHPVIIIPWDESHGNYNDESSDVYGHADGFIKWCGGNRILMSNHGDDMPKEAAAIRKALEDKGFTVTEMRFKGKVAKPSPEFNWAYINFLQVGNKIIMPTFCIEEDAIAQQYIQDAFPECTIYMIESGEIAAKGGALHCLSWNIFSPQ